MVVGLTAAAAALSLAITTWLAGDQGIGSVSRLVVFAALAAADAFVTERLQRKEDAETWPLTDGLYVAAALILPPLGTLLVFALGRPLGASLARMQPLKVVFNTSHEVASAGVALGVAAALGAGGGGLHLNPIAAVLISSVARSLLSTVAVAAVLVVAAGQSFRSGFARTRFMLVQWGCSVSVGCLAGASSEAHPWVPLFALPPVVMVQMVLTEHLRARRDRERINGLFHTAVEAHASVQTDAVKHALAKSAAALLRCDSASIETHPPGPCEWGAQLTIDGPTEWWLILGQPRSGEPLDEEDSRLLRAISAVGSSALENARLVEEIRRQALHDSLTGLANQLLFEDRVAQASTAARRLRERFAVVVLDLDAFKKVNDSLGHSLGNELLRQVADRLLLAVREVDTVARLGSDHFTLLLPGIGSPETASVMSEKLLDAVRRPFLLDGHELFMTASAGVAFFPDDGTQADHLLRNADSAMHRAKQLGRDGYQVYATGMNELAHLRLARESELHNALRRDELRVRYQPQIDLRTGRIVGVEALVRWEHPLLGLIGPHEFVPLAEESGLITDVDAWVLRQACTQAKAWASEGLPSIRMAVNLSGRHFQSSDRLLETVRAVLVDTGFDPDLLELEVTEGIAVHEAEETIALLRRVRELGVHFAIDDFGTGYSVLGRLQRFPVDRLKIDRSFVSEIESAHGEAPIVAAMIAMARSLRLKTVAEGVETLEQQTFLRNHGCDTAQGFLFSHPVEPDEIVRLLRTPSVGFNVSAVS
jgi:diguanylate cyclase (GGDEF)-like protein